MDRNGQAERKMLERICALLLALAGLADRAACRSAVFRLPVLAILARGEAVARSFVMEIACECGTPVNADAAAALASGDARGLAASFRALALALGAMLAGARHPARCLARAAGLLAGLAMPPREAAGARGRRVASPQAPDTS